MSQKKTLRQLLEEEPGAILCPETYDCVSAQVMELCGFKVNLLSSAEFAGSQYGGMSDVVIEPSDIVRITSRITQSTSIPFIVDGDTGYGSHLQTYDTCRRLAQAGASGVLITDSEHGGITTQLSVTEARKRYEAAKAGMDGYDCLLFARSDVSVFTPGGLEEACDRSNHYLEAGADVTLVGHASRASDVQSRADFEWDKLELCKEIARRVPGWKYYPDLGTNLVTGKSDVDVDELGPLGFKLVGIHFTMYGAIQGMLDYGTRIVQDNSNEYFNLHLEDVMRKAFPGAEEPLIPMFSLHDAIDPSRATWGRFQDEGMAGGIRFGDSNPK